MTGERRGRVKSRNKYKGPWTRTMGWGKIDCRRWGVGRAGESSGGRMGTIVIEQQ